MKVVIVILNIIKGFLMAWDRRNKHCGTNNAYAAHPKPASHFPCPSFHISLPHHVFSINILPPSCIFHAALRSYTHGISTAVCSFHARCLQGMCLLECFFAEILTSDVLLKSIVFRWRTIAMEVLFVAASEDVASAVEVCPSAAPEDPPGSWSGVAKCNKTAFFVTNCISIRRKCNKHNMLTIEINVLFKTLWQSLVATRKESKFYFKTKLHC